MPVLPVHCPRCGVNTLRVEGFTAQACRQRTLALDLFLELVCEQCGAQPTLVLGACKGGLGLEWYKEEDEEHADRSPFPWRDSAL